MPSEVPSSGDTRYPRLIAFDLESVYCKEGEALS